MSRAVLGLLSIAFSLSACGADDVSYLVRAAYEEVRILARRQPIDRLLADEALDPAVRAQLELVLASREFAVSRLGLDAGGSYRSLSQVDQDQVIHVVSAAHRDRLESYTWWFPIVGRVPYRGYFQREAAMALADKLENRGFDTYVRRALAFSTLGYFDDPLLSHMLGYPAESLVETILHEILHGVIYSPGQAAFNESFANFVGHRGAIAFFAERGEAEAGRRAEDRWQDVLQFADLLDGVLRDLELAYARGITDAERRERFAAAQTEYGRRSWRTREFDRFANAKLNNAVLLARRVYFERLDLFESVYHRFGGDLRAAIEWIAATARASDDPFGAIERALTTVHRHQSGLDHLARTEPLAAQG